MNANEQTDRTIYVVNWTPDGVGGFEWRRTAEEAAAVARDLADPTARLHVVEVPAEVWEAAQANAYVISEWLDAEGWSDGGDPRTPITTPAEREPYPLARGPLVDALTDLAHVFGITAGHTGHHFTCSEAETIARVLQLAGHADAAAAWIDGHAEGDDERSGDTDAEDLHHGRWIRANVLVRYDSLLIDALRAERITSEEWQTRRTAAVARLADVERYADGRDFTARYELPGAA